jgi:hypothetical protein
MSEFLMLFRSGQGNPANRTTEQMQAQMQRWGQWIGGIAEKGKMIASQPLNPGGKTISGTQLVVTDGPFMEGKEMVGGYMICRADSIEEALELCKGCPILDLEDGTLELREIHKMEM